MIISEKNIKIKTIAVTAAAAIFAFVMLSETSHAATITWIAAGASNWNTSSSWSTGAVPTANDTAFFSASSTQTATIAANASVGGLTIDTTFTGGTVLQSSTYTLTVGASGFSQAAGTFTGGTGAITVNGPYSITGGTFTSTAGNLTLNGTSTTFSSGFQNNGGTVVIATSTNIITGSSTFNNLKLGGSASGVNLTFTVATGTVLTVNASTTYNPNNSQVYLLGGGEIDAKGDVTLVVSPSGNFPTSTFNLVLNGTGIQTVSDGGFSSLSLHKYLNLPSVTITKTSGSVNLAGLIGVTGNWTNTNGTAINPGTSTMIFGLNTGAITITGSSTFNNFTMGGGSSAINLNVTVAAGTVLTVNASTTYSPNNSTIYLLGGGEIDAQGDVLLGGTPSSGIPTSTFNLVLNGTGTQTINDGGFTSAGKYFFLPGVTITKTSGTVNLVGNYIGVTGNWTNTNGTAINPGTSFMTFGFNTGAVTITGSSTFYGLEMGRGSNGVNLNVTVATGTVLAVSYSLTYTPNGSTIYLLGGGEIDVQGTVFLNGTPLAAAPTSTFNLVLNGTSTQTISDGGFSTAARPFYLPSVTINKPSSIVNLSTVNLTLTGSLTVQQGEFQLSEGVVATTTINGTTTISAGARLSNYSTGTSTLRLGSSLTNNGTVFFDGSGSGCASTLPNYTAFQSTVSGTKRNWSGSGNYVLRYVSLKDQAAPTSTPITVLNGTNVSGNANFTFATGPRPQLIQTASSTGGSGTTQLTLPAFGFWPRTADLIVVAVSARNQSVAAPTDTASNTYYLVSSSTFGSSPSYALGLYYAPNINTTSSFAVTANGANAQAGSFLSATAFEYTGMAVSVKWPTSTLDVYSANTDQSGTATSLTSLSATGNSTNELYFGAMTLATSTTASSGSGWTSEAGVTNNSTLQALYTEDIATSSILTTAATWTSAASTSYIGILGVFRSPFLANYPVSGTLDSVTFDTGVSTGVQLNSFVWQGSAGSSTAVKFQFAASNSSSGPWSFIGPDGTSATYFSGNAGTPINLVSTNSGSGYTLFNGYRYFRYRATLYSDPAQTYTPTVTQVSVNWSP